MQHSVHADRVCMLYARDKGITTMYMYLDISIEMLRLDCTLRRVLLSTCTCTCTLYVCKGY